MSLRFTSQSRWPDFLALGSQGPGLASQLHGWPSGLCFSYLLSETLQAGRGA